ncbi:MAG: pyrimidine 5'-nucleotidase [Candidatus Parcubacteria bacterium]|nr:pyrimidine 5'-nucleotidase [Burkholderiales bacterium]
MRILKYPPSRRVWIFDLDNTLHDARPSIFPSMHLQMNAYLRQRFGLDEEGANEMRRFFWERYGTTLRGLVRHHGEDPKKFIRETHRFPELASMVVGENALGHALARLQGKRLVFSNAPRHYVEEVLSALGAKRWFDAVYTIESTRYRPKPAFQGFRVLLRAHNLDPHRCALIDDMPENLRSAKRLGMSTVWVSSEAKRAPFADMRVRSVTELPRLVFRHAH